MQDKVYVLIGEAGEYSDYSMWLVRAFATEKDAQEYTVTLQKNLEMLVAKWSPAERDKVVGDDPRSSTRLPWKDFVKTPEFRVWRDAMTEWESRKDADYLAHGVAPHRYDVRYSVQEVPYTERLFTLGGPGTPAIGTL